MLGARAHEAVGDSIAERHREYQKCTRQHGWRGGRDAEEPADEAHREGDRYAEHGFHGVTTTCPAAIKPRVIAIRIKAPTIRGGAGDGMSKTRQNTPTPKPRARPATD